MYITPMERIRAMLRNNEMSEREFFERQIDEWKRGKERELQLTGYKYYLQEHDILRRMRQVLNENGVLQDVSNLPNSRLIDNQYAKMVDQKAGFLLSKPFSVNGENKTYNKLLNGMFDRNFRRRLYYLGGDALNGGIAWLYPYYGETGDLEFRRFPAYEILPFWADDEHQTLDCAIRLYEVDTYEGAQEKVLEKVELYMPDGIYRYQLEDGKLIPDPDAEESRSPYLTVTDADGATEYNWQRIPLIAFRRNKAEQPLIARVKCLQDALNLMLSDYANLMMEQAGGSSILVIKNYDAEPLTNVRRQLMEHRTIKVRTVDGVEGGVETLEVEVNSSNYEAIIRLLKRAILENARGFEAKDDRLGTNPNEMNIKTMYSDIDLDADSMEIEFQASMEELLWWINQWLDTKGKGRFYVADVEITFNRDMMVNESQVILDIRNLQGLLSTRSLLNANPWVKDVDEELRLLREERAEHEAAYSQPAIGHAHAEGDE